LHLTFRDGSTHVVELNELETDTIDHKYPDTVTKYLAAYDDAGDPYPDWAKDLNI